MKKIVFLVYSIVFLWASSAYAEDIDAKQSPWDVVFKYEFINIDQAIDQYKSIGFESHCTTRECALKRQGMNKEIKDTVRLYLDSDQPENILHTFVTVTAKVEDSLCTKVRKVSLEEKPDMEKITKIKKFGRNSVSHNSVTCSGGVMIFSSIPISRESIK